MLRFVITGPPNVREALRLAEDMDLFLELYMRGYSLEIPKAAQRRSKSVEKVSDLQKMIATKRVRNTKRSTNGQKKAKASRS